MIKVDFTFVNWLFEVDMLVVGAAADDDRTDSFDARTDSFGTKVDVLRTGSFG